jgi:hypothetical protein
MKSSPRLAARDGMEQEPYEFWICPANPESQGKATYGKFRKPAFLASQSMNDARGPQPQLSRSVLRALRHSDSVALGPGPARPREKWGA